MFRWRTVGPAERVSLPSQKGDSTRRVTLLTKFSQVFISSVNGSPSFVRKCMKRSPA